MDEEKKQDNLIEEAGPDEPQGDHYSFPWRGFLIVFGVIITLIIVCVVVILLNGGFYQW